MGNRLFLLDHCCVHRFFGHHAPSLQLFRAYFEAYFDEIITLVPTSYDDPADGFDPALICPFPRIAFLSSKQGHQKRKGMVRRLRTSLAKRTAHRVGAAGMHRRMAQNTAAMDRKYQMSERDLLFFPNAEPHGIKAFCDYFARKPTEHRPRLHFRMIGVHDAEAVETGDPFEVLASDVQRARDTGLDVQISGETPKYVEQLRRLLPDAFLMPYPFNSWHAPRAKAPNTIACLGQGRLDKGYFRIADIVEKVAQTHPHAEWIIHSMRDADPRFDAAYQDRLTQLPNVRLEPGFLTDDALDALYAEASVSMLPYREDIYHLRGSAVLQEALAHGQLCIAPAGTGISSALEFYGHGLVARTDDEFAAAVGSVLDMPAQDRSQRVSEAQARYDAVLAAAIAKILGSRPMTTGKAMSEA